MHPALPWLHYSTNRSFQLYEDEAPARQQYDAVGHPYDAEGFELEGDPAKGFYAHGEMFLNLLFEQTAPLPPSPGDTLR